MLPLPMTVAEGAAFLDEHHQGWEKKIDLNKFNIRDQNTCILGQLYRDYSIGMKHFGWSFADIPGKWENNAFGRLSSQSEWISEIMKRTSSEGNDFIWAVLRMREGKQVTRTKNSWHNFYWFIQNGKFNSTNGHLFEFNVVCKEEIAAKDWILYEPKTYLKDLKTGQKFEVGGESCVKVYDTNSKYCYIDSKNYIHHPITGEAEVKLVK